MSATVAWIAVAPVKGMRLAHREVADVSEDGVRGDRAFLLLDEQGAMVSAPRVGALVAIVAEHDPAAGTLALRFPGGERVSGAIELGEELHVSCYGNEVTGRIVLGAFSDAISAHCGQPLRLVALPPDRVGADRGRDGAVTLLSAAAPERLAADAGEQAAIDARRFRMTFGVAGVAAYEEERWIGRTVRVGETLLRVMGNVGRCVVTTRNPDSGVVDLRTLHHLRRTRGEVATTEPLPFGVHARVLEPGRVRLGDAVEPEGAVP
jgi:uncharacterized protein YcbX